MSEYDNKDNDWAANQVEQLKSVPNYTNKTAKQDIRKTYISPTLPKIVTYIYEDNGFSSGEKEKVFSSINISDASIRDRSDMTREEMQAHLAAQAAQTQAALASQNGAIDARLGRFEERIDQAINSMKDSRVELRQDLNQFKADVKNDLTQHENDLKSDNKSTRITMIVTAVATVIAIAGFNATVLSNMVASFESGKNTMQSINETTKRLEALQARIEAQAERASASPAQPPK